jgi:hypothetical protein
MMEVQFKHKLVMQYFHFFLHVHAVILILDPQHSSCVDSEGIIYEHNEKFHPKSSNNSNPYCSSCTCNVSTFSTFHHIIFVCHRMVQLNVMISLQIALNQLAVIQVNNMCLRVTAARYAQYVSISCTLHAFIIQSYYTCDNFY